MNEGLDWAHYDIYNYMNIELKVWINTKKLFMLDKLPQYVNE